MSQHRSVRRLVGPLACLLGIATAVILAFPTEASAAARLSVSKSTGLTTGDVVTVSGSGFTANQKQIAVGQCKMPVSGPTDCNLAGGATFVNADAKGSFPAVKLKVAETFGSFDCSKQQCAIASQILPGSGNVKANMASVAISFAAAATSSNSAPAPHTSAATTSAPAAGSGGTTSAAAGAAGGAVPAASNDPNLAYTGAGDGNPVLLLWAAVLLLFGLGLVLWVGPYRRRHGAH